MLMSNLGKDFGRVPVYMRTIVYAYWVTGSQPMSLPRTRLSFKQCVEGMSPDCIHTLQESLLHEPNPSIQVLLLMLRLAQGDQDTVMAMHRGLNRETWSEVRKEDLSIQLTQVRLREGFYI